MAHYSFQRPIRAKKAGFDWEEISRSRGEYKHKEFQPSIPFTPPKEPTEKIIKQDIEVKHSRIIPIIIFLLISIVSFFFNAWIGLIGIGTCVVAYIADCRHLHKICESESPKVFRLAKMKYQKELEEYNIKYQTGISEEKKIHNNKEAINEQKWEEEEKERERIRTAIADHNLCILKTILLQELSKLALPVETELSLELNDPSEVNVVFQLPDLNEIPEEELSLTKTGKLSKRKMTQKKRIEIFTDLCAGITLSLAYESFRVINFLEGVNIFGYSQTTDFSTGHDQEIFPLFIKVSREKLERLNLDKIDPSTAFDCLDGIFQCDRKGNLSGLQE